VSLPFAVRLWTWRAMLKLEIADTCGRPVSCTEPSSEQRPLLSSI